MPVNSELEKTPTADTSVNEPASGTYGEKAELDRLRQSLPPMGPPAQQGVGGAAPVPPPGAQVPQRPDGRPKNAPPGVPGGLLAPTSRPGVPLSQPMAPEQQPMPAKRQAADQQRLAILDALSSHPDVSAETREWAKLVVEALIASRT
tara:strand:- start:13070 stop:13513 length:444 start_codon:yes stop_codon:yes gene_type:complete